MFKRYQLITAVLFLVSLSQGLLIAQCPITVSAGPDKFVCNTGGTVALDGSITGQEIGFRWTPSTGLSSNMVLNPTATVSAPVTYTLTAAAEDPNAPNLVSNPGFELGNTGFSSGYSFNPMPLTPGTYFLTTSPSLVNSNFPPCDDHTFGNGTGFMMLVNGNGGPNSQVWCQTIPVMANSWYIMSGWVSTSPISPPALQFVVNNVPIGVSYTPSFAGCDWQEFGATWFSGASTSATVCINDVSGSGNGFFGDDFVLDDISVKKACTVSDMVNVSVVSVNAVLPANITLSCNALETGIVLNGSASSMGPGTTYTWDGPGILSGGNTPMATVNEPGTYTLTVSFDTGDGICSDLASINVLPDPFTVIALASTNEDLSCLTPTASLNGSGSTIGALVTYSWQPASGIVSGINTLGPEVNQPGQYTLLVTHTSSGCTATATTEVYQNITPAVAVANALGTLPCIAGTLTLNGAGSSSGSDYTYQWTGPGIVSGSTTINNCIVNTAGLYTLLVTNEISGCTATATVGVTQSGTPPVVAVAINAPGILNCNNPILTLNSTGSSTGTNFTYQWGTTNGHFTGPVNGQTAMVDSVGLYVLTITNTQNGCTASAPINVTAQFTAPAASVVLPISPISCMADSVQINAGGSSVGIHFRYQWTTINGVILSGDTTLMPWVGAVGNYQLVITDTTNGCTASITAAVLSNTNLPVAMATVNAPGVLNCIIPTLLLNSAGSTNDSTLNYQWTTPNGHFTGAANGPTATIDSAGLYILNIIDTMNGCVGRDTVSVDAHYDNPTVDINQPMVVIDCTYESVQINALQSSGGPEFQYLWSSQNGIILSGDTTLALWVGTGGDYSLTITNTSNGCTASGTITILQDVDYPVTAIITPAGLDCSIQQINIDASGSSGGSSLSATWVYHPEAGSSSPGFVSGQNTLTPLVNAPGTYTLTLLNTTNHCESIDSVVVMQDINSPVADAGAAPFIDCTAQMALLNGAGSSQGAGFVYQWTGGSTTLQLPITSPGTYFLTVTNTTNQCNAIDSVIVSPFGDVPVVSIDSPALITCLFPQVQITGNAAVAGGQELTFQWTFTGSGSGIVTGDTTLTPVAASAGTYTLTVLNTQTGCTATDTVVLSQSSEVPVADAGPVQTLLCGVVQVTLDGTMSTTGNSLVYKWSTLNGSIQQGENTLIPNVNAPGNYTLMITDTLNGCSSSDDVLVIQDANAPVASAGSDTLITCISPTIILDGTGSSVGTTVTYLWSTANGTIVSGGDTPTPEVGAAGIYTLEVTNTANNCQSVATVNVVEMTQPPLANASAPQSLTCIQKQVTLNGSGSSIGADFSYLWSGPGIVSGENTLAPVVDTAGPYSLTVTDISNGCTSTATITAIENTVPPVSSVNTPQSLTCTQNQILLDGSASSTGIDFTYIWTGPGIVTGETTLSPTVDGAGNYLLIVTDQTNGCTSSNTVNVTSNTTAPTAIISAPPSLTCSQTTVMLDGSGSFFTPNCTAGFSGPGIVFGGNTLTPIVIAPGSYILTIVDTSNGCTSTATTNVVADTIPPTAIANALQNITCLQNQVTLTGNGSSTGTNIIYEWSGPGIVSGATSLSPVVNVAGDYSLTVTNQTNGCTSTAQTTANQIITPPNIDAGPDFTLTCKMPNAIFQGYSTTPDAVYEWVTIDGELLSGQDSPNGEANSPGTYTLIVTDPLTGCTASSSIVVYEILAAFPQANSVLPDCITPTGSITFSGGGNGPFLYSKDGGLHFVQSSVFSNLDPGIYPMVIQDFDGCEQALMIDLPEIKTVSIQLDSIITLQTGNTVTLNPQLNIPAADISTIIWTPVEGLSCNDCLQPAAQPQSDITYNVLITNADGCTASASVTIKVQAEEGNIFVPNTFSPDAEGENKLFRVFTDAQISQFSMRIYDRWGSSLFITKDISTGWDGTAKGKLLNPGIYIYIIEVELINGNGTPEKRLLKGDVLLTR